MSIINSYSSAIEYLNKKVSFEALQPPAQASYKMSLDHLVKIDKKLKSPHESLKIIHVAGTKGKGSVCMMLEHYLRSLGQITGLFTSPHLYRVNERVRINGKELTDLQFTEMINDFKETIELEDDKILSYFETMTLAAFMYFKKQKVNWVILEAGLGGRLDSTNIVKPLLSVITRIDLDHTSILGNTHQLIAAEKAGIMKENVPVIALFQKEEVNQVFEKIAKEKKAKLFYAPSQIESAANTAGLNSAEIENFSVVKTAIIKLKEISKLDLNLLKIDSLLKLKLPGRYESFTFKNKTILLDVAHNYISYLKLIEKIKQSYPCKKVAIAFNSSRDKDIEKMGKLIKENFSEIYILPVNNNPRIFTPNELALILKAGNTFSDLKIGIEHIIEKSSAEVIVFTGSFYLISEVGKHFNRNADLI